jgi:hypothetical protein
MLTLLMTLVVVVVAASAEPVDGVVRGQLESSARYGNEPDEP